MMKEEELDVTILAPPYGSIDYVSYVPMMLYNCEQYAEIETAVKTLALSKGVCAKVFGPNDVAWSCETCQKDENCVICQDCFEHSNHSGHLLYPSALYFCHNLLQEVVVDNRRQKLGDLERDLNGCCDCGDPEAWDDRGFCTSHAGFIEEDAASVRMLPESVRKSVPAVIQRLVTRLHNLYCTLDLYKAALGTKLQNVVKEIRVLLNTLLVLSETSPIFLHEIARNLSLLREHCLIEALHGTRYRVTVSQKISSLDILVRVHHGLDAIVAKETIQFLVQQIKSKALKSALAQAYIRNYEAVMSSDYRIQFSMWEFAIQFLGLDEAACKIFGSSEHIESIVTTIKVVLESFNPASTQQAVSHIQNIVLDISCLLRTESIKVLVASSFLKEYLNIVAGFGFVAGVQMLTMESTMSQPIYVASMQIEQLLLRLFGFGAQSIDYENVAYCRDLAAVFKPLLLRAYETAKKSPTSFFTIPLHRCLSLFLVSYTQIQLLVRRLGGNKQEEKRGATVRIIVQDLFDIQSDTEYNQFVLACVQPVLKAVGFLLEGQCHKWVQYGDNLEPIFRGYKERPRGLKHYDLSLCLLLLSSLTPPIPSLMHYILESLSQPDDWLRHYFSLLLDESKSGHDIEISLQQKAIPKDTVHSMLNHVLFLLCGLCTNDCLPFWLLMKSARGKYVKQPYQTQLADEISTIKQRMCQKELVHTYFVQKDISMTFAKLTNGLPKAYLKDPIVVSQVYEVALAMNDPAKGTETFQIKPQYLQLYDPFYYLLPERASLADEKAEEIYKTAATSKSFNPLFGCEFGDIQNVNLTANFRQVLAKTEIVDWLNKLLKRGIRGEVSVGVLINVLKLVRALKRYMDPTTVHALKANTVLSLRKLRDDLPSYGELWLSFEAEIEGQTLITTSPRRDEKENQSVKARQQVIVEERKQKRGDFPTRHTEYLGEGCLSCGPSEFPLCAICKETLRVETYESKPYGKLLHVTTSSVYWHCVKGNIDLSLSADPASTPEAIGLALTTCGHAAHCACLKRLPKSPCSDDHMQKLIASWYQGNCPICNAPYSGTLPPSDCLRRSTSMRSQAEAHITATLSLILNSYKHIDPNSSTTKDNLNPDSLLLVLSKVISYSIKVVSLVNLAEAANKQEIFLSLFYCWKLVVHSRYPNIDYLSYSKTQLAIYAKRYVECEDRGLWDCDTLQALSHSLLLLKLQEGVTSTLATDCKNILLSYLWTQMYRTMLLLALRTQPRAGVSNQLSELAKLMDFMGTANAELERLTVPWFAAALTIRALIMGEEVRTGLDSLQFQQLAESLDLKVDAQTILKMQPPSYISNMTSLNAASSSLSETIKQVSKRMTLAPTLPLCWTEIGAVKEFAFAQLQDRFTDCLIIHYKRKCKTCQTQMSKNALCLLCGDILCTGTKCCNKDGHGELFIHSLTCGLGTGIFFYFCDNVIILVSGYQSSYYPSPYVNSHGESINLSRSKTFEPLCMTAFVCYY